MVRSIAQHEGRTKISSLLIGCFMVVVCIFALSSCASTKNSTEEEAQAQNRQYINNMVMKASELSVQLEAVNKAVSSKDIVTLRTEVDKALKIIDEAKAFEAPEALKDVQSKYNEALDKLKQGFDSYATLFTDVTNSSSFDWSGFESQIETIQKTYDEGINLLSEADKLAAGKE